MKHILLLFAFTILVIIGIVLTYFPHSIHCQIANSITPNSCVPHYYHVLSGLICLIVALFLAVSFKMGFIKKYNLHKIIAIILGTSLLDAIFHATSTHPFETWDYFVIKALIAGILGYFVVAHKIHVVVGSLLFMFGISFYYRFWEKIVHVPFGKRVPTISFGKYQFPYQSNPVISAVVWSIVHTLAFLIATQSVLTWM